MKKKDLLCSKHKVNKLDKETETFGCRHTNPDICSSNSIPEVCAFTSKDCICKKPPRSWKKLYAKLNYEQKGDF